MKNQLWDAFLLVIGLGAIYCLIPFLLLSLAGLFLGMVMKIVTPPETQPTGLSKETTLRVNPMLLVDKPLSIEDVLALLKDDKLDMLDEVFTPAHQAASWEDNKLFTREAWLGFGRWLVIILIYAVGVSAAMLLGHSLPIFLAPPLSLTMTILMGMSLIVIALVGMRQPVVPKFDEFPFIGWFVGTVTSIGVGVGAGLMTCQTTLCVDDAVILYAQLTGLIVGLGTMFGLITLAEWWAIWGMNI